MKILIVFLIFIIIVFGLIVFRGAPYVPSRRRDVRRAFKELYPLSDTDVLVDIGSGDGVVLRESIKAGAGRAVGIELNPILVLISRLLSRGSRRITVRMADFWLTRLPDDTTVVYVFGESRDIEKMAKKVRSESSRMNRVFYLISYGFALKDGAGLVKQAGAHYLYKFDPLQSKQA